jgi:hypothetical protein
MFGLVSLLNIIKIKLMYAMMDEKVNSCSTINGEVFHNSIQLYVSRRGSNWKINT